MIVEFPKRELIASISFPQDVMGLEIYKQHNRFDYELTYNCWLNKEGKTDYRRPDKPDCTSHPLDGVDHLINELEMKFSDDQYEFVRTALRFVLKNDFISKDEDKESRIDYLIQLDTLATLNNFKSAEHEIWIKEGFKND